MQKYILFLLVLFIFAYACKDEPIGQQPIDSIPPGKVTNVEVKNTPGGAIISYSLPEDEDLLYVKAIYSLKDGVESEARSSLYADSLKIEGFGDVNEHQVSIIAVDRSRNESEPVLTTVTPEEPYVSSIGKTLTLVEDFGGVHAYWENPNRAEISVIILKEDNNGEYVPIETFYSTVIEGEGAKRGMDTLTYNFGIYVQDRWENKSEVKYFTLAPLFEKEFDPLNFEMVTLPDNPPPFSSAYTVPKIWDGGIGPNNCFVSLRGTGVWPQSITFDLGTVGKISRIVEWQRQGSFIYANGNMRLFEVYGCETLDPSGDWDSWTKLMECESIKPSGLPLGTNTAEDIATAAAGEEYTNSPKNPKVRYLRIKCLESWVNGDFFHISEIKVYGDDRQ